MVSALIAIGGAAKAYNDDVAEKKAQLAEIQATTAKYMVEAGLQKIADRKEALAESKARVNLARNYGFSRRAAMAMEMSGQLSFELDKELGTEKIAPNYVEDLTTFLENKIDNDEDLAAAIARGLQGESLKDDQELSVALINAMGDMNELQKQFLKTTETPDKPSVPRFKIQSTKGERIELSDMKSIRSQLASTLNTIYADSFQVNQMGEVTFTQNAKPEVQRLFNTLSDKVKRLAEDPTNSFSATSALNTVISSIQNSQNVSPVVVVEKLDEAITTPNFNWEPFRTNPTPSPTPPGNGNNNNNPTDDI
jgi:hypothetical protein